MPGTQPPVAIARPTTAKAATTVAQTMPVTGPRASRYSPGSVSTKAIGARNAGSAYFRACHIVGTVRPPVMALAPTAASAVGGVTSESTE
jgi:hypothetical protein